VIGAGGAITALAGTARAENPDWLGIYINPGAVFSWSNDPVGSSGVNFELSAGYNWMFTKELYWPHAGAFFRAGAVTDGSADTSFRGAIGAEGGVGPVGLELGYGWRDAASVMVPDRKGLILSPYLTGGLFYIGPEWFFPLSIEGARPEVTLNFGLKLPTVQVLWVIKAFAQAWRQL
jgi:hypothetical protein